MTIDEIVERVEKVSTETHYWFVRTNNGELFEEFYEGGYIAIGWDYVSLYEMKNRSEEGIKYKIATNEKIDLSKIQGKIKTATIYNKLNTFISLKIDDVVVIPSANSDILAFGLIDDNAPYEEEVKQFIKRRKVKWYLKKPIRDLNSIFYQIKSNQHAISNIDIYAPHIDRVMGNLFKKGDKTHFVLNIEKTDDVNFDDLRALMDDIKKLTNHINRAFDFNENLDEFYIKINLQSRGVLELIKKGKSLAVLAYLLHIASCGNLDKEQDQKIESLIRENKSTLNNSAKVIDRLKIDTTELTKPFKN